MAPTDPAIDLLAKFKSEHPDFPSKNISDADAASALTVERLTEWVVRYRDTGDEWYHALIVQLVLHLSDSYERLKKTYLDRTEASRLSRLHTLAWITRGTLELCMWTGYSLKDRANARKFYEDQNRDGLGLVYAMRDFFRFAKDQNFEAIKTLEYLEDALKAVGSTDAAYTKLGEVAVAMDFGAAYYPLNKILSKFAHPTALMISASPYNTLTVVMEEMCFLFGVGIFTATIGGLGEHLRSEMPGQPSETTPS